MEEIVELEIKADVSGATQNVKELNQELEQTKENLDKVRDAEKQVNTETEKTSGILVNVIERYTIVGTQLRRIRGITGGVIPVFKKFFKTLKLGIASTGIGLLVIAITSVATAMGRTSKGAKAFKAILNGIGEIVKGLLKPFELVGDAILKLFGVKESGAVDTARELAQQMDKIDRTLNKINKKRVTEREQVRQLEATINDVNAAEEDRLAAAEELNTLMNVRIGEDLDGLNKRLNKQREISEAAHSTYQWHVDQGASAETLLDLYNRMTTQRNKFNAIELEILNKQDEYNTQEDKHEVTISKVRDTNTQKRIANDNTVAENNRKNEEEQKNAEKKLAGIILKIEQDLQLELIESEKEKELKILEFKNIAAIKDIEDSKATRETKDKALLLLDEQYLIDQEEIKEKYRKIDEEGDRKLRSLRAENRIDELGSEELFELEQLELKRKADIKAVEDLENRKELEIEINKKYARLATEIEEDAAEKRKQLDHDVLDAKLGATAQGFAVIASMSKEGSAIAKKAAIAEALVTGSQSVLNAYTSAQKSPITALFPAYPVIQAGLAAAFSAAQIKKISAGEGPEGTVPQTGGTDTTPSPQMMTGAFTLEGAEAPEPLRAYVVTDEMTNSQNQLANIRRRATI